MQQNRKLYKLYDEGNYTIQERKELLIEERQKLIEKYEELGETIDKLESKINNYENREFEVKDVKLQNCE